MKKDDFPRCPFCPADHTIIYLFTECGQATLFWKEILDWASCMVNSKLSPSITGSEIAPSWSPIQLEIQSWRPEFHSWSPASDL